MAKLLPTLHWVEDLLPSDHARTLVRKPMFGGFGFYLDEKLTLLLFEGEGSRSYRGMKFKFELWNGCMFPADHEKHPEILTKFPFLIEHPVLPKWLYLPSETEDFENRVEIVLREIRRRSQLFGTLPKAKKPKREAKSDLRIDTRKPMMFREITATESLNKARKISDLRNLGPVMEKALHKAGITSVSQFVKLGWKQSILKLTKIHPRYQHTIYARVLIGALKNLEWNRLSDEDKTESQSFIRSLPKLPKPKSNRKRKPNSGRKKTLAGEKKLALKSAKSRKPTNGKKSSRGITSQAASNSAGNPVQSLEKRSESAP